VADAAKVQANEVEQLAKYTSEIDRVINLNIKDVERTCAVTKNCRNTRKILWMHYRTGKIVFQISHKQSLITPEAKK